MSYLTSSDQITKEYISRLIEKEVLNINVIPVSEGLTQCLKAKVEVVFVEKGETKELKLFLKSFPTKNEYNRELTIQREFGKELDEELTIMHNWAHNYEMKFYKFICDNTLPDELLKVLPKCYFVKENVIAVENLCETKNAKILSMWDPGLNFEETASLLKAYARFHGLSMKLDLSNQLASYDEIAENRDIRIIYSAKKAGFDLNERLAEISQKMDLSALSKENLKIIKDLGFSKLARMFSNYKSFIHGDANPNNILVDDGWEKVFFVDFQEGSIGNPMADIGWFMITSGEIGDEKEILEMYFKLLSDYSEKALDFNTLMNDYYVGIVIAAYLILMVVGVVSSEYKETFFWKLVNSCVIKLNKYESEINLLLKK